MLNFFKKKSKNILIEVTIYIEQDNGVFFATSPTFPGFCIEGQTEEELLVLAKDATLAYLESLIKQGDPLPISTIVKEIPPNVYTRNIIQNIPAYC